MSNRIKLLALLGLFTGLSACASYEEIYLLVPPEPISQEPAFTGKYK